MSRNRATNRKSEPPAEPVSLPEVTVSPSKIPTHQRDAYWLALADDPQEFRKAVATEDYWPLLQDLPAGLWGDRLSLYLYRMPDDDGIMVKNADGAAKYIKPVIRHPIDEDYIATKNGGGKYKLYLKLDSKENLREHTFRIDGPPKVQPGQIVEIDGRPVTIGAGTVAQPTPAAAAESTDVAKVIEASAEANRQNMEILAEGSKAAIALVRDQAAPKTDANQGIMEKLLGVILERALTPPPPPPDPLAQAKLLKELLQPAAAPEPAEPKDPPITEAMTLVESLAGKPFSELIRGKNPSAPAESYGWVQPVMAAASQLIATLPQIIHEARIARTIEFERQVWARNAKPGETPPAHLVSQPRLPQPANQPAAQPATTQTNTAATNQTIDKAQLATVMVEFICRWFDARHSMGYQCAAAIDALYGDPIEAVGFDQVLGKQAEVMTMIQGHPELARRAQDARWAHFQEEFLLYLDERWGFDEEDDAAADAPNQNEPLKMPPKSADKAPLGA